MEKSVLLKWATIELCAPNELDWSKEYEKEEAEAEAEEHAIWVAEIEPGKSATFERPPRQNI